MNKIKPFKKPILDIVMYFLITIILSSLFSFVNLDSKIALTASMIAISLLSTLYVIYVTKDKFKGQGEKFLKNFKANIKTILKYWFLGLVCMMFANAILIVLLEGIAPNEEANREVLGNFMIYSIIYTCILAPIAEELLFRLNFRECFKNKKTFILGTGLIFGAMHVVLSMNSITDILYIIPYSILGSALAKIYIKTDNIFSSVLAHMIHNTFTIIVVVLNL